MINDHVRDTIDRFPLGFVATVTPGGRPAVSPKGTFLVLDDKTVAFGDIRSPGTVTNLTANPECEVNFVNILTRKGARLRGQARMLRRGTDAFEALIGRWHATWPDLADRIGTLVVIDVAAVKPLTTPPYDDGAAEEEMIAAYKAKLAGMYP